MERPEDLGIKIGSKKEAWLQQVKTKLEEAILQGEENLIIDNVALKVVNKRILEEQTEFQKGLNKPKTAK